MAAAHRTTLTLNSRQPVAAADERSAPVLTSARACLVSFERCISITTGVDLQRQSSIEDQIARFSIWTFNMGVFVEPKASLDHRLREVPEVRDMVVGLLGVLDGLVQQLSALLGRLGDPLLQIPERNQLLAGGAFERALQDITGEITLLHELSNTIRKAGRKSQNARALRDFTIKDADGNELEEALKNAFADNILDRFPGCSETIRRRLASTMVLRRNRILYRRHRHASHPIRPAVTTRKPALQAPPGQARGKDRPSRATQPGPAGQAVAEETRSVVPSTAVKSATTLAVTDFKKAQAPSVVSNSRTIALGSHEELVFPRAPRKHIRDREHVKNDLDAYVCLFEDCDDPEELWTHSESWLKHMRKHALRWRCPAKSHRGQHFETQEHFRTHLVEDHKKNYSDAELALLTDRSRQATGPLFMSCPLCGGTSEQVNGKLEEHIAGHLRSLALKSLPPVCT
ncbi:hypothetical protein F5883DRAFT_632829 [Diaporthe sp. PMI_573]|nr:hypothetical protein F5883DRAFT_632829 [Diaporthaceae sp. PMI_573]